MQEILAENPGGVFEPARCILQWAFSQHIHRRRSERPSNIVDVIIQYHSRCVYYPLVGQRSTLNTKSSQTILFACPARPHPPRPGGGAQSRAGFSSGQLLRSSCGPGRLRRGTLVSRHRQQEVHRDHCSAFAPLFHRDVGTSLQTPAPLRPQPPPHQLVWGAGEGPGSS